MGSRGSKLLIEKVACLNGGELKEEPTRPDGKSRDGGPPTGQRTYRSEKSSRRNPSVPKQFNPIESGPSTLVCSRCGVPETVPPSLTCDEKFLWL
jgi:hypothetical protein